MTDLPIACTLLESERQQRRAQLLDRVFTRVRESQSLDDGYALRFAAEAGVLADLTQLIELEHECCAFLRVRLTVEPGNGPMWLELTGPPGTKAFLESALAVRSKTAVRGA